MINKSLYVNMLNASIQKAIIEELKRIGLDDQEIKIAITSRLYDLEDTIDINKILSNLKNNE